MNSAELKPLVVTVHGLNSDGEWQFGAEKVLAHHCDCAHYHYRDYRYWGFALQFLAPAPALVVVALCGALLGLVSESVMSQAGSSPPSSGIPMLSEWTGLDLFLPFWVVGLAD